jgi:hypothetical protein
MHTVGKSCIGLIILIATMAPIFAANSQNYRVEEDFIGGGGLIEESSANYKASESIGDIGVGDSSSDSYRSSSGFTTTNDPTLSFLVNTSAINFGALSTSATATATSTFSVINYTSHGYVVTSVSSPPKTGNYTLAGMASTGPSQTGVEQFGINLRANTSPVAQGADPVQDPDGSFSFGVVAAGYNTPDNYRYVAGENIASAPKSSGRTNYTISYIVNASNTTAGGTYTGTQELICTGTY